MAADPKSLPKRKSKARHRSDKPIAATLAAPEKSLSASKAKTHLLKLLDSIDRTRVGVVITKRGRPIAKLVPVDLRPASSIFGCMKGTFRITGDIVGPEPDVWEAIL